MTGLIRSRPKVAALLGLVSALGFAALARAVSEPGRIGRWDAALTAWLLAQGSPGGYSLATAVSLLGAGRTHAVLIGLAALALLWRADWRSAMWWIVAGAGTVQWHRVLKATFGRERPAIDNPPTHESWSFPSGHAMDSLVVYGFAAWWVATHYPRYRVWSTCGVAVLVGAIGASRVYAGHHHLTDVVGGYCAGFVWLLVCLAAAEWSSPRESSR